MNIGLTLLGQMIAFAIFVWLTMKYIWPPLMENLEARRKRIADGLAAAEEGKKAQADAQAKVEEELAGARSQAADIISRAEKRAAEIVEEAREEARGEGERIVTGARGEIDRELNQAKESLRGQVSQLAMDGARQILGREIDSSAHAKMLDDLAAQL